MKQNPNRIILLAAAVLLFAAGCTKEAEQGNSAAYSDVPILAVSELAQDNVAVVPQGATRNIADPTQTMTFHLVRADETGKGTGIFGAYATTPLTATRAAGTGVRALTFDTPQYYLVSEAKTRLTGWYPMATNHTGSIVSWTFDGSMDILTAPEQGGNRSAPMPNLVFNHALSQVQIHAYAPDANTQATWGTITKIELMEQINTCTYDFATNCATGVVMPEIGTTGTFAVSNIAAATIPITVAAQVGDPVMIAPQATATVLKLEVTTSKLGKVTVSMPAGVYAQGKAYILKLKFNAFTIDATASIGTWQTVERSEQEVVPGPPEPPKVGDVVDNGVVYYVNPDDKSDYRIVAMDRSYEAYAQRDDEVGVNAQSRTDGRKNTAAIKAYAQANTLDFAAVFYSVHYCDSKGDGWYLPAINELQVMLAAKDDVNPVITANSGEAINHNHYSSTENPDDTWEILFVQLDGTLSHWGKRDPAIGHSRCIKRSK